jgi:hypothetical protein
MIERKFDLIELLILEALHELITVREEYFNELRRNLNYLTSLQAIETTLDTLLKNYRAGKIRAEFAIPLLDGAIHMVERIRKDLENLRTQSPSMFHKIINMLSQLRRLIWKVFRLSSGSESIC